MPLHNKSGFASHRRIVLTLAGLLGVTGAVLLFSAARHLETWAPELFLFGCLILAATLTGYLCVSKVRARQLARANQGLRCEISERLRAEETLRHSEERYRLLFEDNPLPMWVYDLDSLAFLEVNAAAIRHYGYSREEFLRMSVKDIRPPEDIPVLLQKMAMAAPGVNRPGVWRHLKKDGTLMLVEITTHLLQSPGRRTELVLANDVTERQRAEDALKASDSRFRTLFELAPDGIFLVDLQGRFVDGNKAAEVLIGYPKQEIIGKSFFDLKVLPPQDLQKAAADLARGAQGQPTGPEDYTLMRKDGQPQPVEIRTFPIMLQEQKLLLGIARDQTERRRAEQALRSSEARLQLQFNCMPMGCITWDPDHRVRSWNPSAEAIFGFSAAEALGKAALELILAPELQSLPKQVFDRLRAGEPAVSNTNTNVTKDGRTILCEWTNVPLFDDSGAFIGSFSMVQDITERKSLEKQLLRAQRLESIGTLAAGIAHDLNNILAPILMSAQLLEMDAVDDEQRQLLATIHASAKRGADVVTQVLTFARGAEGQRMTLQIKHLLKEIQKIFKETFPKNIKFALEVPKDLWTITGDATQLHQVLLNLCVNARDAMPNGGTLTISARNDELTGPAGLFGDAKPGPHVRIQVMDTGSGIPAAIMEKVFDPFFTTKEPGKGTGLGLSTVLGIVRSHGGFIDLQSEVGRGSTFAIYLPAQPLAAPASLPAAQVLAPKGDGEWILVVDDEPNVRTVTERTLSQNGYRVLAAAHGREALEVLSTHPNHPQAVVTDIMMPVMDGVALAQAIKDSHPRLPVIACTGWGQEGLRAKLEGLGVEACLQKPYPADELLRALRKHLAQSCSTRS
jgi:PAS domain S-box-containing protein